MASHLDLIGVPFAYGGRDPNVSLDCYGLVMEMHRRHNKKVPPDYESPEDRKAISKIMLRERHNYRGVPSEEGYAKVLTYKRDGTKKEYGLKAGATIVFNVQGFGCHVGYIIAPNKFIHTWEQSGGVIVERIDHWEQRILGIHEYE
jgi:cell wall-associated NlpC family hydrolase